MKQINKVIKLETRRERMEFFDSLWTTDEFKALSQNELSLVGSLRETYINQVRYYYKMQDKELERSAFTSWYGVFSIKKYDNAYIQDLYTLHELTHQCTMPYFSKISFDEWTNKMRENEVYCSLVSEVYIYLERPELREKTFSSKIWADSFLNKNWIKKYEEDKEITSALILEKRKKLYDNPKNKVENELARFREFSYYFYNTWIDGYLDVEKEMIKLKQGYDLSFDRFLRDNQSEDGILFKKRVEEHYNNYLNFNFVRPHY